jgi:hypothetical protein
MQNIALKYCFASPEIILFCTFGLTEINKRIVPDDGKTQQKTKQKKDFFFLPYFRGQCDHGPFPDWIACPDPY